MGNRRSRDRQLAKLAARRQRERAAAKRRRDVALGVVGVVVAATLVVGGFRILTGGSEEAEPSATSSPSAGSTGAPEVTGRVTPQAEPPSQVACGGDVPRDAGEPKPQFDRPPGVDLVDRRTIYRATIETSCGAIVVRLDAKRAPQAVSSFVFLAREGFFDGLTFHRVVPGYVIQAGDPLGTGAGGPGYTFAEEVGGAMRYDEGTLAMAKGAAPASTGSQWFIVSGPDGSNLDSRPEYTIFGQVIEGMDVVAAIDAVPVEDQTPRQAVYIESITILERKAPADDGGEKTPTATETP